MDGIVNLTQTSAVGSWGLDRIDQRLLPLNGDYVPAGAQGQGVDVFVLDTGECGSIPADHDRSNPPARPRSSLPPAHRPTRPPTCRHAAAARTSPVAVSFSVPAGIRTTHSQFGGRAFFLWSAYSDLNQTADGHGHGTHCAGTIAGSTFGVAPTAQVCGFEHVMLLSARLRVRLRVHR